MTTTPAKPATPAQTKIPAPAKPAVDTAAKKRKERTPLPEIPLTAVTAGRVNPEEAARLRPVKEGTRNETQKKIDEHVKQAHQDWIAAGRDHKVWEKMAPWTMKVPKAHEEGIKAYICKGGLFHGVQIRFGRSLELPDGIVAVTFVAKDRAPKKEDAKAEVAEKK